MAKILEKEQFFLTPPTEIPSCLLRGLLFKQWLAIGQISLRSPPGNWACMNSSFIYYYYFFFSY